ncbi:hypothetical protein FHY55_14320 [Oceanicola sp. D3]|uniref:hypothetical protein n=1 Tax=Oceanicola sp. D3 TaxID=2587163 RepID=UPI00111F49F4|nr:hypothetical protein [Oceanicola sp. D3]QDC10350.1 hypothetical protein FHY55_14320 [Oceanicola sp. D3]
MFQQREPGDLKQLLDGFEVPMFAVERRAPDAPWVLLCINTAHANASGMNATEVAGREVTALLPEADADWACARYHECTRSPEPLRYVEKLTIAGQRQEWDTSLQRVRLPDGGERVIGTALVLRPEAATLAQCSLSTIRDQAVEADWHLSRVTVFLEGIATMAAAELSPARLAVQAEGLAATCRNVSSLVSQLRRTAERIERNTPRATNEETTTTWHKSPDTAGDPAATLRSAESQVLQG